MTRATRKPLGAARSARARTARVARLEAALLATGWIQTSWGGWIDPLRPDPRDTADTRHASYLQAVREAQRLLEPLGFTLARGVVHLDERGGVTWLVPLRLRAPRTHQRITLATALKRVKGAP